MRHLGILAFGILAVAGPVAAPAAQGDLWLDVNVGSRHSEDRYLWRGQVREYNERNLGLGLGYEWRSWLEAKAGWFENSYEKTSVYAVVNAKWDLAGRSRWLVAPGISGGLITGYHDTPEQTGTVAPWGLLTLSLGNENRWRVVLGYLPSQLALENSVDVATLQLSWRL